jgi:hypothetical protein
VFGLLVVAIVCGVVAGRGAAQQLQQQVRAPAYIVPQADCKFPACNALIWGNPPTQGNGAPLPAGATCTMAAQNMWLCVTDPVLNCLATANIPNGCPGLFWVIDPVTGQLVPVACYQAINRC